MISILTAAGSRASAGVTLRRGRVEAPRQLATSDRWIGGGGKLPKARTQEGTVRCHWAMPLLAMSQRPPSLWKTHEFVAESTSTAAPTRSERTRLSEVTASVRRLPCARTWRTSREIAHAFQLLLFCSVLHAPLPEHPADPGWPIADVASMRRGNPTIVLRWVP